MAKVALIDDHLELLDAYATPLTAAGHTVLCERVPLDFEAVLSFQPQVLLVGLSRAAAEGPIIGYQALAEMEAYPAIQTLPIILVGHDLQERDVPTTVNYDLFLTWPHEAALLAGKVDELATKVKTRRRISAFVCPRQTCRSRLVYWTEPPMDLFCPKCGVSVAIIDDHCTWLDGQTGISTQCPVEALRP
jgi:hypothetical protein